MTMMESHPRAGAPQKVAVRVLDSDVHPVPKPGVIAQYWPEPYRSKYLLSHPRGETITYDAPDYAYAKAMRGRQRALELRGLRWKALRPVARKAPRGQPGAVRRWRAAGPAALSA